MRFIEDKNTTSLKDFQIPGDFSEEKFHRVSLLPEGCAKLILQQKSQQWIHDGLVKLVFLIERNRKQLGLKEGSWIRFPKNYFSKSIGSNYHRPKKLAESTGIIEVDHRYHYNKDGKRGVCKSYRIPERHYGESPVRVEHSPRKQPLTFVEQRTYEVLRKMVTVDVKGAYGAMERYIAERGYMEGVKVDSGIPERITHAMTRFGTTTRSSSGMCSRKRALEIAAERGLHVFYKDRRFTICSEADYHQNKQREIREKWSRAVDSLSAGDIYSKIGTNGRLFSNITNFPSKLMPFVKIGGERTNSSDLKNSQMIMAGKRGKKKGGISAYSLFYRDSGSGTIYETMQKIAGLDSRKDAKGEMFKAVFSSYRTKSETKDAIKKIYPGVMEEMDEMKRKHGKASVANTMQQIESNIFIKRILHELYLSGYDVLSCHDSIIFRESDGDGVLGIMNRILREELGEYVLETK